MDYPGISNCRGVQVASWMGTLVDGVSPPGTTYPSPLRALLLWLLRVAFNITSGMWTSWAAQPLSKGILGPYNATYYLWITFWWPSSCFRFSWSFIIRPHCREICAQVRTRWHKNETHVYALSVKCSRAYTREMTSRSTYLTSPLRFIHQCPH